MTSTSDTELREMAALREMREAMNASERETMHRVYMAVDDALAAIPQYPHSQTCRDQVAPYFSRVENLLREARRLAGEAAANVNAKEFA